MAERPRRQPKVKQGELQNFRIRQVKVIGENGLRSNKPAPQFEQEGDCACALV